MSSSAFKTLAREHLSAANMKTLDACTLTPFQLDEDGNMSTESRRTQPSFVAKWQEWERALRLNLAKVRMQKLKREGWAQMEAPQHPAEAVGAAKAAVALESPLEAEMFLDKARWEAIESFQGLDIFDESAIYAYLLKLLILERKAAFNAEEGFAEYKGLYAAILGESK